MGGRCWLSRLRELRGGGVPWPLLTPSFANANYRYVSPPEPLRSFEKYMGGKYLGELVRCILSRLLVDRLFLVGGRADAFPVPWAFNSDQLSEVEM